MLSKDEIIQLLHSEETYRVERTVSTGNMDKFCEAICAFANDLPDSRKRDICSSELMMMERLAV